MTKKTLEIQILPIDGDEFIKMHPDAKNAWIDALRSGEYKQGRKFMAFEGITSSEWSYCCLGVLCMVTVNKIKPMDLSSMTYPWHGGSKTMPPLVPHSIMKQSSKYFDYHRGKWSCTHLFRALASYNDGFNSFSTSYLFSFKQIAEWISKNL